MAQHSARGRALVLAAGLALAVSLAACSGSADDVPAPVPAQAAPQLSELAEPPAPEASTPPAPAATPPPSPISDEPAKPDPPTSTPAATSAPPTEPHDPSVTPVEPPATSSSPPALPAPTPTPTPCLDLECIEPAPGVFEQRTFEDGEEIDWTQGIFVLDPETGRTEGYALVDAELGGYEYQLHSGGWIVARGAVHSRNLNPGNFLLDRETGQSWRWPSDTIWPMATSREHLVFSDWARLPRPSTYHFTITNRALEAVSRFSIPVERSDFYGFFFPVFSPDGRTFVFGAGDSVYLMAVGAAAPTALIQWGAGDGPRSVSFDSQYRRGGPDLYLVARYENESGDPHVERHRFRWEDGLPLDPLEAACEAQPQPFWDSRYAAQRSPDGRYVAQFVGGYVYETHTGVHTREDPWPSVVIAEAATCAPLFRVRSARLSSLLQTSGWLATSDGFVVGTDGGRCDRAHPPHPRPGPPAVSCG